MKYIIVRVIHVHAHSVVRVHGIARNAVIARMTNADAIIVVRGIHVIYP